GTENAISREVEWSDPAPLPSIDDVAPEHWQTIHDAMVGVTRELHGTGRTPMLKTPYTVAAKTGTAQAFSVGQDEKYDRDEIDERLRDHGLFIAFAPAEAPE